MRPTIWNTVIGFVTVLWLVLGQSAIQATVPLSPVRSVLYWICIVVCSIWCFHHVFKNFK